MQGWQLKLVCFHLLNTSISRLSTQDLSYSDQSLHDKLRVREGNKCNITQNILLDCTF